MRLIIFVTCCCVHLGSVAAAEELDLTAVRRAVNRSLPWLASDMIAWRQSNDCAACHHGPMYLWSGHIAKRQGYSVDEDQLQSYARWMIEDEKARIFPAPETIAQASAAINAADRMTTAMMGHRNLSQPTLYLAHALNAMPIDDPLAAAGWRKVEQHWAAAQMDDGSFAGRKGWSPIFNTPQILTLFAATALHDRLSANGADQSRTSPFVQTHRRADEFLLKQIPDATHQGVVLRMLTKTQADDVAKNSLIQELRSLQRDDGGWSQTSDRPSDAFAVGQSLYAMYCVGVPSTDDSVRRGLAFLVRSQAADGTWPMTSRNNPETGKPADNLNPITYAATAWAVIGISCHVSNR